jgi:hypothetical protein
MSFIYQWLPPPCQTSCFFVTDHMLVFPGFSSILPTLFLEKELTYVYECICVKGSGQVDAPTLKNVSQCSTTINHVMPQCFNGTMFGKVFSSPIPTCLAPTTVHHLPTTATAVPSPDAVFHDSVVTPSTDPHCSTINDHAFKGSGQVNAPTPEKCFPVLYHHQSCCASMFQWNNVWQSVFFTNSQMSSSHDCPPPTSHHYSCAITRRCFSQQCCDPSRSPTALLSKIIPYLASIWELCLAKIFTLQSLSHQHQSMMHLLPLLPLSHMHFPNCTCSPKCSLLQCQLLPQILPFQITPASPFPVSS